MQFSRPYTGLDDQLLMMAVARQTFAMNLHVVDLPYRFCSWSLDDPQNGRLWFDDRGELSGWAVMQSPFWTVDIVCVPEREEDLFPQMLDWADERAQALAGSPYGHESWYVMVFSEQRKRRLQLEEKGFACHEDSADDCWKKVLLKRSAPLEGRYYPPPVGFIARSLTGRAEVEAYVALHQEVFETRNMTIDWRERTINHPGYLQELDIVVETPEGGFGAFCVGWLTTVVGKKIGHVEPLGSHPQYRHHALGLVALEEVLLRMSNMHVDEIYVETDVDRRTALGVYRYFGFAVIQNVLGYSKDYPTHNQSG